MSAEAAPQVNVNLWQDISGEAPVTQEVLVALSHLSAALIDADAHDYLLTGNVTPDQLPPFDELLTEIEFQWREEEVQSELRARGRNVEALGEMFVGLVQKTDPHNPESAPFFEFMGKMRSDTGEQAKYSLSGDTAQSDEATRAYTLSLYSSKV